MDKKMYYVSIASQEISQIKFGNNNDFTIYATDNEVKLLRSKMEKIYDADIRSYWRAHVPIMPYHLDKPNDDYDMGITEAFQMIHDLGDEQTKSDVTDMGVLGEGHI